MLDEIRDDVWHILFHLYSLQEKWHRLAKMSPTRHEMSSELVAINSIAESIVVRVARLADKRRDVRSIKNYCKKGNLSREARALLDDFNLRAQPVVDYRHERVAHMKAGDLSRYRPEALPNFVVAAIEKLVLLVDCLSSREQSYIFKPGSHERQVDLRASVTKGHRVEV